MYTHYVYIYIYIERERDHIYLRIHIHMVLCESQGRKFELHRASKRSSCSAPAAWLSWRHFSFLFTSRSILLCFLLTSCLL